MGDEQSTEAGAARPRTRDSAAHGTGSRRTFLRAAGAVGAFAGVGGLAGAQGTTTEGGEQTTTEGGEQTTTEGGGSETATQTTVTDDATTVVLGGRVAGWLGLAPDSISGAENPTLDLRAGERYRLVWVNLDGAAHEWLLEDGEGTALERTGTTERVGETRAVAFEASESAAGYRCEYHPEQMLGAVELGEGFETTADGTTETADDGGATETTDAETTTAAGGEVTEVAVGPEGQYLRFVPEEVEISVGDTVRWVAESEGHNVTAKPEAATQVTLPEGAEPFATYEGNRSFMVMAVGETFEHTFTVPGEYVYVCAPHAGQGMVGRVLVSE